jgi:signal peptide peptidase SppA
MLDLIQHVAGRPWAIRAEIAAAAHGLVRRDGIAGLRHLAELKRTVHAFDDEGRPRASRRRRTEDPGLVAVVPVVGVLTHRGDVINSAETRSVAGLADEVTQLASDARVSALALDVDSPGGEVYGVPEAWQAIHAAAKVKPVVAVANAQMASAALYLGSAASELWVTPSGEVGSLGVYALHVDESRALDAEGVGIEFIVADDSPHKVEGNPYEPLSDDARAQLRKTVNRYMAMFERDVARGRGVPLDHVRRHFGKGRMLGPEDAVAVGMADRVGTLEEAIAAAPIVKPGARRARTVSPAASAPVTDRTVTVAGCAYTPAEFLALVDRMHAEARRAGKL